jgi:hypothetical protein
MRQEAIPAQISLGLHKITPHRNLSVQSLNFAVWRALAGSGTRLFVGHSVVKEQVKSLGPETRSALEARPVPDDALSKYSCRDCGASL